MAEQNSRHLEAAGQDTNRSSLSPRPGLFVSLTEDNRDSSPDLLDHKKLVNADIPVTPDIDRTTYQTPDWQRANDTESEGYFMLQPSINVLPPNLSKTTQILDENTASTLSNNTLQGVMSGKEGLGQGTGGGREYVAEITSTALDLELSGNIISVTFNAPRTIKWHKNGECELGNRHGSSALFDSFAYLSSDEVPWHHTVIAWTGEVEYVCEEIPSSATSKDPAATSKDPAATRELNHLSAPVPVDGDLPHALPNTDGLRMSREQQRDLERQLEQDKRHKIVPVWLCDDSEVDDEGITLSDQGRWRRYAEQRLYPLFHYKLQEPNDGRAERIEWANYYLANRRFADKIIEIYKPGDIVVVHDYYLLLLPSMLRQRMPNMYISFFLHCPFPSSEFLRCLPRRKEVLEGLMGSNLIGFQSYSYSRHFTSCCTRILDFPSDATGVDAFGTRVDVGVFPIGIDTKRAEKLAWSKEVTEKYDALKEMYKGMKIIVGRERLDSVRGVTQKLMAFERFLEIYPEWREKVVLIQVTSPTNLKEGKESAENKIARRVNELVMKINGTFGSLGFSPVQHYPQYLAPDEYFALLRAADIGLITSVRDGMNTTSLEYIVCQRDNHGPLILSEFSGTAGSLRDAIHINPWDLTNVAKEINNALTMSPKKRETMRANLYSHVTTQSVQSWIAKFLRKLVSTLASHRNETATPVLDGTVLLQRYREARKRLFLFDYDGTLTPIVRDPLAAIPSDRVIHILKALAADHRNAVWIISGRDQEFLQQHLGHITELGFSAEHGSFIRYPGATTWENLAETLDLSWREEVLEIFEKYTNRVPGSSVERKRCALTWHYRQADPELGPHTSIAALAELKSTVARKWDVEIMKGKANLEVRPTFINKGEIAKRLVHQYSSDKSTPSQGDNGDRDGDGSGSGGEGEGEGSGSQLEFVLCCGDDFTDEDMFNALNGLSGHQLEDEHVFTVSVGARNKVTLAKWHVLEPADVLESVSLLVGVGLTGKSSDALSQVNLATTAGLEGYVRT
ncbi:trehalose-phosphatase [Xylaria sp. CBS 124048]|nr:trehalose-phosphatase [Xylaria sp. CBS 124048]